jgi:hypothetical protein
LNRTVSERDSDSCVWHVLFDKENMRRS